MPHVFTATVSMLDENDQLVGGLDDHQGDTRTVKYFFFFLNAHLLLVRARLHVQGKYLVVVVGGLAGDSPCT